MHAPALPIPALPTHMQAMVTQGQGGYEQLQLCTLPLPRLQAGEVLLQVLAAGINNTDINTRLGWYGRGLPGPAEEAIAPVPAAPPLQGWNGPTPFPLIQGADCCGRVVAQAPGVQGPGLGQRVLVRSCMRVQGFGSLQTRWLGTDFNGAFAQYVAVPACEAFAADCDWSDAELASLPCAWGTAENMLQRAALAGGERVWISGASGGVGSATVQLAKRRGAHVTALTSRDKRAAVVALGADCVLCREDGKHAWAAQPEADVVVDNVGGAGLGALLGRLRRGGRYVTSGAIGGAEVALDLRTLYLNDLRLIGCTAWDAEVFPNLVAYVQRGEIRPALAATYALADMARAQQDFLQKAHVGKLVVLPWTEAGQTA